jgi:hypothetical protein
MTSSDGTTWTRSRPFGTNLLSVAYGNGLFVAVGGSFDTNWIITSPDGMNWTPRASPPPPFINIPPLRGVAWGGDYFVAVDRKRTMRSGDGINWVTNSASGSPYEFAAVTCGAGRFVATGPYTISWSTNVTNWFPASNFVGHYNSGIAYGNGYFVIVGNIGVTGYSTNGHNWTGLPWGQFRELSGVTFGAGQFVAVGMGGVIATSTTATNWPPRSDGPRSFTRNIACSDNECAFSDDSGIIRMSSDFMNWRIVRSNTYVNRLAYVGNRFIGVWQGLVTVSGQPGWTNIAAPTTNWLWDVTFGKGTYVISGLAGTILTSTDALNWTLRSIGVTNDAGRIAFGNEQFVTLNYSGDAGISTDGVQWTFHPALPMATGTSKLTFGNGMFVAIHTSGVVTNKGLVITSRDGLTWSRQIIATNVYLNDITFANGILLIAGEGPISEGAVIFDSRDGTNWTRRVVGNLSAAYACAGFAHTFLLGGSQGAIVQSGRFPWLWLEGSSQLILDAHPGTYRVEATESLLPAAWDLVTNATISSPSSKWQGTGSTNSPRRFYRAVLP